MKTVITIGDYELVLTSTSHPEQYDVFLRGQPQQVAYLRLRHGKFRADMPCCGGRTVYEAKPDGEGSFDEDEREQYLTAAIKAIHNTTCSDHGLLADPRSANCSICGCSTTDWIDPDWARGRICRSCETKHEPREQGFTPMDLSKAKEGSIVKHRFLGNVYMVVANYGVKINSSPGCGHNQSRRVDSGEGMINETQP